MAHRKFYRLALGHGREGKQLAIIQAISKDHDEPALCNVETIRPSKDNVDSPIIMKATIKYGSNIGGSTSSWKEPDSRRDWSSCEKMEFIIEIPKGSPDFVIQIEEQFGNKSESIVVHDGKIHLPGGGDD